MHLSSLLASTLAALGAAETLIGHFGVEQDITSGVAVPTYGSTGASVAGINAIATTYHIKCQKGAPKSVCDIKKPWTMIQGPETYSLTGVYTVSGSGTANVVTATRDYDCTFTSSSISASCDWSIKVTGTTAGESYSTSTSLVNKNIPSDSVRDVAMLVTGGTKSFTAPAATKTPAAAPAAAKPMVTAGPLGAAAIAVAGAML